MPLGMAECGSQKSLDQVPRNRRADGSATHTNDIHVVVFDALHRCEMVVNDRRANTR